MRHIPADQKATQKQKIVVINDSVRKDGGKPTDDKPVAPEQIEKIEKKALDHTVDETGS